MQRNRRLRWMQQVKRSNSFILVLSILLTSFSYTPIILSGAAQQYSNILNDEGFSEDYSLLEIGQYRDRYGYPVDLVLKDDLVFVASGKAGLLLFNVSNPTTPVLLSDIDEERLMTAYQEWGVGNVRDIAVEDDLTCLADDDNGLVIINTSNPFKPEIVGKYLREVTRVKIQQKIAYIICQSNRSISCGSVFQIINITTPSKPILLAEKDYSLTCGHIYNFEVVDNYVYALSSGFLLVFNVSNPSNPEEILRLDLKGAGSHISIDNNFVYVTNFTALKIVNITNPEAPELVSELSLEMEYAICSVHSLNDTVYVASSDNNLITIINSTDKFNPTIIKRMTGYGPSGSSTKRLACKTTAKGESILFCSDSRMGLYCFNVTNTTQPELIGAFDTNCEAYSVFVDGDIAYICSHRNMPYYPSRLEIISISNKSKPRLLSQYDFVTDTITDVHVSNGYAYVLLKGKGLEIFDVSDPTHPFFIAEYDHQATYAYYEKLWFDENSKICYIAHWYYDLLIVDCSDPNNPTLLSSFEVPDDSFSTSSIFVQDDIVYLSSIDNSGLLSFIDVSDPKHPEQLLLGYVDDPIADVYVRGNYAYLLTAYDFLLTVKVKPLSSAKVVASCDSNYFYPWRFTIAGDFAFVAHWTRGLRVVDLRNPKKPIQVTAIRDHYRGLCYDVFVQDEFIYIADGWDGLEIYQLTTPKVHPQVLLQLSITIPLTGTILLIGTVFIQLYRKKK